MTEAVAIGLEVRTGRAVAAALKAFAREVGTPWCAQERHAALAAWLALPESGRAP